MNANPSSFVRDVFSFFGGAAIAAVTAALVFLTFFPLPEPKRTEDTREALAVVILVSACCGGFIGRRAFSAEFWSDLLSPVIGSYGVIGLLCLISSLDFSESALMIGFVSAGILTSTVALLILGRRFPSKHEIHEV